MKHPYIPLYVGDWLKDPQLSLCSPATRGVWIDLICRLHELGQGGKITANAQQLARLCRSSDADIHAALKDLQTTDAAEVSERDGIYTVVCRRMRKVAEISLKRQQAGNKSAANREQTPDNENESGTEGLERVREFAKAEGISMLDAEWFYHKGRGNGWTNGGKPILDWKATLRSWKRAGYLPSQKSSNGVNNGQRQFGSRPKEKAPSYPKMSESREPTPEEREAWKKSGETEVAKLRQQFGAA